MPGDCQYVLTKLIKFSVVDVMLLSIFNNTVLYIQVLVPQDSTTKDSSRQGYYLFSAGKEFQLSKECIAVILRVRQFKMFLDCFHTEDDGNIYG
jgi:hypothetical protein